MAALSQESIDEFRARTALETALSQLDSSWLILVDLRINGPTDATAADYVAIHPGRGIALIDVILSRTGDPAQRLRKFLDDERFSARFPGTLPIVRLVLKPTEAATFGRRVHNAFTEVPPITVADPNWVAEINSLLVPTAPSAARPIFPLFKRPASRADAAAPSAPRRTPTGQNERPRGDEAWDVVPERWPDKVAGATPLKRTTMAPAPAAPTHHASDVAPAGVSRQAARAADPGSAHRDRPDGQRPGGQHPEAASRAPEAQRPPQVFARTPAPSRPAEEIAPVDRGESDAPGRAGFPPDAPSAEIPPSDVAAPRAEPVMPSKNPPPRPAETTAAPRDASLPASPTAIPPLAETAEPPKIADAPRPTVAEAPPSERPSDRPGDDIDVHPAEPTASTASPRASLSRTGQQIRSLIAFPSLRKSETEDPAAADDAAPPRADADMPGSASIIAPIVQIMTRRRNRTESARVSSEPQPPRLSEDQFAETAEALRNEALRAAVGSVLTARRDDDFGRRSPPAATARRRRRAAAAVILLALLGGGGAWLRLGGPGSRPASIPFASTGTAVPLPAIEPAPTSANTASAQLPPSTPPVPSSAFNSPSVDAPQSASSVAALTEPPVGPSVPLPKMKPMPPEASTSIASASPEPAPAGSGLQESASQALPVPAPAPAPTPSEVAAAPSLPVPTVSQPIPEPKAKPTPPVIEKPAPRLARAIPPRTPLTASTTVARKPAESRGMAPRDLTARELRPASGDRGPPIDMADLPPSLPGETVSPSASAAPVATQPASPATLASVGAPRVHGPTSLLPSSATRTSAAAAAQTGNTGEVCRSYTSTKTLLGQVRRVNGLACRDTNGQWQIITELPD